MIIWGEQDKIFPLELGHRLNRHLEGNSQLVIIKNAGHAVNLEKPKEFCKYLKAFLVDSVISTTQKSNSIMNFMIKKHYYLMRFFGFSSPSKKETLLNNKKEVDKWYVIGLECISNDKAGWSITPPQDHNEPLGILILKYGNLFSIRMIFAEYFFFSDSIGCLCRNFRRQWWNVDNSKTQGRFAEKYSKLVLSIFILTNQVSVVETRKKTNLCQKSITFCTFISS